MVRLSCEGVKLLSKRDLSRPPRGERGWIAVGLGSNLGAREEALAFARRGLSEAGFRWERASSIVETDPVGGPAGQGRYLNQVLAAPVERVALDPPSLLALAHRLEAEAGRTRRVRWEARVLDIDLLIWGETVTVGPPRLPHPRLAERRFVLEPLAEVLGDAVVPPSGRTVAQLLAALDGGGPCGASTPRAGSEAGP